MLRCPRRNSSVRYRTFHLHLAPGGIVLPKVFVVRNVCNCRGFSQTRSWDSWATPPVLQRTGLALVLILWSLWALSILAELFAQTTLACNKLPRLLHPEHRPGGLSRVS